MTSGKELLLPVGRILALLAEGELTVGGRVPWSSNATLLAELTNGDLALPVIYKPRRGERPLWDFPAGTLGLRETAAFVVSRALGWGLVPPTVLRDGPWGPGAVQVFVPHDPEVHYLAMEAPDPGVIRRLVAFDVIVNNADRKSGHVLLDAEGKLWAIDHGVTFHVEPKLRTVIWDYAGEEVPPEITADLSRMAADLANASSEVRAALRPLLAPLEIRALRRRTRALVAAGRFPAADPSRREHPWPPV